MRKAVAATAAALTLTVPMLAGAAEAAGTTHTINDKTGDVAKTTSHHVSRSVRRQIDLKRVTITRWADGKLTVRWYVANLHRGVPLPEADVVFGPKSSSKFYGIVVQGWHPAHRAAGDLTSNTPPHVGVGRFSYSYAHNYLQLAGVPVSVFPKGVAMNGGVVAGTINRTVTARDDAFSSRTFTPNP